MGRTKPLPRAFEGLHTSLVLRDHLLQHANGMASTVAGGGGWSHQLVRWPRSHVSRTAWYGGRVGGRTQ